MRAIQHGELEVRYQPIVDLHSELVAGFEALVRWHHPRLGLLNAGAFVSHAEACGLVTGIDDWVLRTVARQIDAWLDDVLIAPGFRISVNTSAIDLARPGNPILSTIRGLDVDTRCLTVEVTETSAVPDHAAAAAAMQELQRAGVGLALDDFGAAYGTFDRLRELPFDQLKLDRNVMQSTHLPVGRAFVTAAMEMASTLGLVVTAEGIETPDHLALAATSGAHRGQGFLWSTALTATDATDLLETGRMPEPYVCVG